jgi:hypothetical protein
MLQLFVKALLQPFALPTKTRTTGPGEDIPDGDSDVDTFEEVNEDEEMEDSDNNEGSDTDGDAEASAEDEVAEAFDGLTDEEHEQLLDNPSAICIILNKVQFILITWIAAVTD